MRDRPDRPDPLADYATTLSSPIPDYLRLIERRTHLRTVAPQMMSGRLQGRLLAMLSKLLRPSAILELGTFTGYASLCLAEGLAPGGYVDTMEGDPEMAYLAREHFQLTPLGKRIRLHEGTIAERLPTLPGPYDLIFLDADKQNYPSYLSPLTDRLRPGGLLIADNVLWDGKAGRKTRDRDATALREYNERIVAEPRLESVVLPLRDGLSLARRCEQ